LRSGPDGELLRAASRHLMARMVQGRWIPALQHQEPPREL
jgi:hypothetical protein